MMREIPKWSDVRQAKHFKFGYIYSWTMATCGKYQSQKYKLALNGGVVRSRRELKSLRPEVVL